MIGSLFRSCNLDDVLYMYTVRYARTGVGFEWSSIDEFKVLKFEASLRPAYSAPLVLNPQHYHLTLVGYYTHSPSP